MTKVKELSRGEAAGYAETAVCQCDQVGPAELARALFAGDVDEVHGEGGVGVAEIGHRYGLAVPERFLVLAVSDRAAEARPVSPVELHQRISELCGWPVPAVIGRHGGTVLAPEPGIVAEIGSAVDESTLGVVSLMASRHRLAPAARQAHELLDVVNTIYGAPGLYPFADFALEHQLTRPGPGRDRLAGLIAPVADHPDLLTTLRTHLRVNLHRGATARTLYVHPNTVDHRLRKIAELTGLDILDSATLWQLHAAAIVHDFLHPDEAVRGWRPARGFPRTPGRRTPAA
ncbi:PucR family transcriptional regulator [Nocardia sp. SSK8]|uniref:PucR family transcriptional regulator n=1 Tax=Nocardia sp. SSK8 TaxID=3120154 RepID=UPI00300998D0